MKIALILLLALMPAIQNPMGQDAVPEGCAYLVQNYWPVIPEGELVFQQRHQYMLCEQGYVYIATFWSRLYSCYVNIEVSGFIYNNSSRGDIFRAG